MSGKIALVTGATRGIGKSISTMLVDNGYHVIATGTNPVLLNAMASTHITPIAMDVSDNESIQKAFSRIKIEFQSLDFIINSAGIFSGGPIVEMDESVMAKSMDVNFMGLFRVVQTFFPLLHENNGRFIQISSEIVNLTGVFTSPYGASKAAAEFLCDTLRRECLFLDIDIIIVQPGAVKTDLFNGVAENMGSDSTKSLFADQIDAAQKLTLAEEGKACTADQVASIVLKAMTDKKPQTLYRVNQDPMRRIFSKLPARIIDNVFKKLLNPAV